MRLFQPPISFRLRWGCTLVSQSRTARVRRMSWLSRWILFTSLYSLNYKTFHLLHVQVVIRTACLSRATPSRLCPSLPPSSSSRPRWRTRISESSLTASTSQRRPPSRRTRMLRFSLWIFSWNTDASHVQNLIIRMGDSKHHSRSGWHWWERLLGYHNP